MVSQSHHWLISTYQLCPLLMAKPSYVKMSFEPVKNSPQKYKKAAIVKTLPLTQSIDHLILEGLSVVDIIDQMDLSTSNKTQAKLYVYERKRAIGYKRKVKQTQALELMKDKNLTDEDIAKRIGMHKRYVRFLRVANSRGRL